MTDAAPTAVTAATPANVACPVSAPPPPAAAFAVSVRALCEFTARAGDLDLRYTPAPSALEGMEGHRLVQARRGPGYEAEVPLSGTFGALVVRGRADGFDAARQQLEEIKTYRGDLDSVRPHQRALHWAQARVYGYLLCQARALDRIHVALVYAQTGTGHETVLVETHTAADLQAFFEDLCTRFQHWAHSEQQHRQARDAALAALTFPHGAFRAGQRDLAVAVYRSVRADAGQCLLAQAPTGIGKTLGTLFPMLQASARKGLDKLFFLTAKGTGHALALEALARVQAQLAVQHTTHAQPPPLQPQPVTLRVLDVLARDKVCEHPDKACHGESCPLAQGFYDRLPAARSALQQRAGMWDGPAVRAEALAHRICPYYLAQEMAQWCDVAVADYHYYYDSAAMLYALTVSRQWKVGVLVDEAHNLPDRARRMYTAELQPHTLAEARRTATGAVRKALDKLQRSWSALQREQDTAYRALPELPADLTTAVERAIGAVAQAQSEAPLLPGDPVLTFYLEALHFAAMAEQFGTHAVLDVSLHPPRTGGPRKGVHSTLCIRNIVPAPHLQPRHAAAQASVFFSGTLTPAHFYQDLLGLPAETPFVDVDSPFHAGQLAVQVVGHVSTRYADRDRSLRPLVDVLAAQYALQPGNYLCFASSFDYLQRIALALQAHHPEIPQWQQTAGMDEAERAAFLQRFQEGGQGMGFAVLGGAFSEGVDLPGHRLIGAFIATLGLPQVNPVNEQMRRAMDLHFGSGKGYDYTYLYPGLRKVVQAAGRVIRTEQDRGVVFLMDDRYQRAQVRALLPSWWHVLDPKQKRP